MINDPLLLTRLQPLSSSPIVISPRFSFAHYPTRARLPPLESETLRKTNLPSGLKVNCDKYAEVTKSKSHKIVS